MVIEACKTFLDRRLTKSLRLDERIKEIEEATAPKLQSMQRQVSRQGEHLARLEDDNQRLKRELKELKGEQ